MLKDLPEIIISPPFGNYLNIKGTTSVRGSYTLFPRPGLIKQVIKTLRPVEGGWQNKIGLRNPGIASLINYKPAKPYIVSITAVDDPDEWLNIFNILKLIPHTQYIELNMGCPNANRAPIDRYTMYAYMRDFKRDYITVKLSPRSTLNDIAVWMNYGVKWFHLSNTVPHEKGGISGKQAKAISLPLVTRAKNEFGNDIKIIGGGGVYTPADFYDYKNAGADKVSLSTIFFNPIKARTLLNSVLEKD